MGAAAAQTHKHAVSFFVFCVGVLSRQILSIEFLCVCVCVCVRERETEWLLQKKKAKQVDFCLTKGKRLKSQTKKKKGLQRFAQFKLYKSVLCFFFFFIC